MEYFADDIQLGSKNLYPSRPAKTAKVQIEIKIADKLMTTVVENNITKQSILPHVSGLSKDLYTL
jgi:hypothetical protein